jgi:DNA-binding NarL/FixJ family response regulator
VISVVLADDQELVRTGIRKILESESDLTVRAEAADGEEAVAATVAHRPEVVLMDIRMPRLDGLAATRQIMAQPDLPTAVIILTTFDPDEYVYDALRAGASGFLLKTVPADDLVRAVRLATRGEAMLAPSVTARLIARFAQQSPPVSPPDLDGLTPRELDVLRLVAGGLSNAEIGERLFLSPATVKTHVASMLQKLRLRDRVQLAIAAYESGFITPTARPNH